MNGVTTSRGIPNRATDVTQMHSLLSLSHATVVSKVLLVIPQMLVQGTLWSQYPASLLIITVNTVDVGRDSEGLRIFDVALTCVGSFMYCVVRDFTLSAHTYPSG